MKQLKVLALCLVCYTSYSYDGQVDPSFGNNGTTITRFSQKNDVLWKIRLQKDDKIIAAASLGGQFNTAFAVARYTKNGTLDKSFNALGKTPGLAIPEFGRFDTAQAHSAIVQPDGKIVVAGYAVTNYPATGLALARYYQNGTLDKSFNAEKTPGTALTSCCKNGSDQGYSVALQKDGKIVVGGKQS